MAWSVGLGGGGVGCDNIHCTEHMCDATQLTWLGLLGGWGDDSVHGTCKHGRCYGDGGG